MPVLIHSKNNSFPTQEGIENLDLKDVIWVDLLAIDVPTETYIESKFKIEITNENEAISREESARFYEEDAALYMNINVPARQFYENNKTDNDNIYMRAGLGFILTKKILFSVRNKTMRALEAGKPRASARLFGVETSGGALCAVLTALIERQGDFLANIGRELDEVSIPVLTERNILNAEPRLKKLGQLGAQLALNRDCLSDIAQLIHFITPHISHYGANQKSLNIVLEDVLDLQRLNEAQTSNLSFLLDATLGLVGARQSRALNFIAVVTLLFAPPTLIASIFGMNFEHMEIFKEVSGPYIAFGMMGISALVVLIVAKIAKLF